MATKDFHTENLDPVRVNLLSYARKSGESLASLSSSLGKNPAYLQQFIRRGSPRKLPEDIRYNLAHLLGVDEASLGGIEKQSQLQTPVTPGVRQKSQLRGFAVRLASARQKSGYYSQSKFELATEIPKDRYVALERGDDDPTIAELDAISGLSGISLNWLVKG